MWFYRVLLGFTGFGWVIVSQLGFTGGFGRFHGGSTGFERALLSWNGFDWVFTGFYRVFTGFGWFLRIPEKREEGPPPKRRRKPKKRRGGGEEEKRRRRRTSSTTTHPSRAEGAGPATKFASGARARIHPPTSAISVARYRVFRTEFCRASSSSSGRQCRHFIIQRPQQEQPIKFRHKRDTFFFFFFSLSNFSFLHSFRLFTRNDGENK